MTIRAILFDFGGVVATSPFLGFRDYETRASLPEGFLSQLNTRHPDENAWACMERGELEESVFYARLEEEARALGGTIEARLLIGALAIRVRPEMVEAVRGLKARGYLVACLTNNMRLGHGAMMSTTPEAAAEVDAALRAFDLVIESCKVGARKPEVRFYRLACEALGVSPEECVFLDDLGINLKAARALGMTTIKVRESADALRELEAALA